MAETIAEWLRRGIEKPGKSQAGLARALRKDPSAVHRMLHGKRRMQVPEVRLAARYLEESPPQGLLPPAGLSEGAPPFLAAKSEVASPRSTTNDLRGDFDMTKDEATLIRSFRSLDSRTQLLVLQHIQGLALLAGGESTHDPFADRA